MDGGAAAAAAGLSLSATTFKSGGQTEKFEQLNAIEERNPSC